MKGRPEGSVVRNRIITILNNVGISYGYELYKIYKQVFGNVHIRTIYYNLKKGIEKEEIIVVNVAREIGDYSWGDEVEKIYYTVGPYADKLILKKDDEKIKTLKLKAAAVKVDWDKEVNSIVNNLKKDFEDYENRKDKLSSQGRKVMKQRLEERYKKVLDYCKGKSESVDAGVLLKGLNPHTL